MASMLARCRRGIALLALAASAAQAADDPLAMSSQGAADFARACRQVLAGHASPAPAQRWRNASELLAAVHPEAAVRDAATACEAALDAADRPRAVAPLQARLAALERTFQRRLTEHDPRLRFTRAEVAGMPAAWLAAHRVGTSERFELGIGLDDYHQFMQMADDPGARRRMYFAHANRGGAANLRTLQEIVDLRRRIAQAQGHRSHYAAVAARYGLPDADAVAGFLAALQARVAAPAAADVRALESFAVTAPRAPGAHAGIPLARWDAERLLEVARDRVVGEGDTAPASRLPADLLLPWLEAYFGRLAEVDFGPARPASWQASTDCMPVSRHGAADAPLGLVCLDTAPRPGKYYNYATFFVPESGAQPRTAVVLANVAAEGLLPDEVQRMFAEFSVALSLVACSGAHCAAASDPLGLWSSVQRGFFGPLAFSDEALGVLRETAPGPLFPAAVAEGIRAGGAFAAGLQVSRQLEIARFDFELADASARVDVVRRWQALEAATPFGYTPGTYYPSRLNMVASAPGGSYYTALWAQAASLELWRRYAGRTLAADAAPALRGAFFGAAAPADDGASPATRLLGQRLAVDALGRLIEQNTIAAVAERLRQQHLTLEDRR